MRLPSHFTAVAKTNDIPGEPVATFIKKVYTPAISLYLRTGDTSVDGMSRKISALFVPVQTCDSLAAKLKANVDLFQQRMHRNKAALHLLMDEMLSPQRVLRHGNLLLNAHVLYLVTAPDNTLVPKDQLIQDRLRTAGRNSFDDGYCDRTARPY
jgi:hypothetical protein